MQNTRGCSQSSKPSGSRPAAGEHKGMSRASSNFIAGVFLPARKEKLSIWEAMRRGLLSPGTALVLLEAQAASGLLMEPLSNARLSVQEALARGLIGHDFLEKLLSAEGAVTGYTEPYTGQKMSLFQAMGQGLILRDHGIRLLQAQLATGGIIDPERGHRVPVEVAYERGYLDQEMNQLLSDPESQTRSCFDPNTHENLTYLQLLRRCVPDPDTGLLMLQLMDKGSALHQLSQDARTALQAARTSLPLGLFQGHSVSAWELLFSRYVPEQRRQELLRQYKAGTVSIAEMIELLTAMVTRAEAQGHGANVAPEAAEREALPDPKQNGSAPNSQNEREQDQEWKCEQEREPKRELEWKWEQDREPKQELEQKWEREQELKRDQDWKWERERDPKWDLEQKWERDQEREQEQMLELKRSLKSHTLELSAGGSQGRQVSLWELLFSRRVPDPQREELLREYRAGSVTIAEMIELLTALVTGAESENGALDSPTAKIGDEGSASPPGQEQRLRKSLKSVRVRVTAGELRGRNVSVLDLLFSGYVPQGTRQELLELYRAGVLSTEQVATVVTNMVTRAEAASVARSPHRAGEDEEGGPARLDDALKATAVAVPAGELRGTQVSLWELLFSQHIPEEKRQELLQLYREGFLTLELMATVVSTLIRKKESTGRKFHVTVKGSNRDPGTAAEGGDDPPKDEPWETTLKTTMVHVEAAEFRGHRVSLWELLHCRYIPEEGREELLELYRAGELSLEQVRAAVSTMVSRAAAAAAGAGPAEPGSGPGAEPVGTGSGHKAEPVAPVSGHRAEPAGTGSGHRAEPVGTGSGHRAEPVGTGSGPGAEPVGTGSGHRAEPVTPVSGPRAEPVAPVSGPRAEPVALVSGCRAEPVAPVSGPRAEPVTPVSGPRAEPVALVSGHRAEPVASVSATRAEPVGTGSDLGAEPVAPVSGPRAEPVAPVSGPRIEPVALMSGPGAEPVATEAEPSPLHQDRAWEETPKASTARVPLGEVQGRRGSLRELLSSQHIPEERRQELLGLHRGGTLPLQELHREGTLPLQELHREGTLPLQELPSTTSSRASDSPESPLRAPPLLTVDLLRSEGSRITLGPCQEPCQEPCQARTVSVWELLSSRRVSEFRREARLETFPRAGLRVKRITVSTSISSELRQGGDNAGTGGTAWHQ